MIEIIPEMKEIHMRILSPQIPKELTCINDFLVYAHDALLEETPLCELKCCEERMDSAGLS
jgi:hypothetical protein